MARLSSIKERAAVGIAGEAPFGTGSTRLQELLDTIDHALSSYRP